MDGAMDLRAKDLTSRSLLSNVFNWLNHLYNINPYPDRFQMGLMARQSNLDGSQIKKWFNNRRARDWRKGKLCRQCRYFKSSLVSEESHRLDEYTRHCVAVTSPLVSDNQEQIKQYAQQDQNLKHQRTPLSAVTTENTRAAVMNNNRQSNFVFPPSSSFNHDGAFPQNQSVPFQPQYLTKPFLGQSQFLKQDYSGQENEIRCGSNHFQEMFLGEILHAGGANDIPEICPSVIHLEQSEECFPTFG